MEPDVERLVRAIHASAAKAAVFVTGGASQGASWMLCVPGASSTVLEVVVPYSRGSLAELLGHEPEQYASADAAVALAAAAYRRAAALSRFGEPVVGLGAACALASEPPKRGQHRAYVAAAGPRGSALASLVLAKGRRSRWQEEELVGRLVLQVLAQACGLDDAAAQLPLPLIPPVPAASNSAAAQAAGQDGGEQQQQQQQHDELRTSHEPPPAEPLADLLAGRVRCVEFSGGRVFVDAPRGPSRVYLPGSFNPLHEGHTRMLQAAVAIASGRQGGQGHHVEGCFELTVTNADKGQLALEDVGLRVAQFVAAGLPLLVTSAPLLVDKAGLLPGATFVLGWDTAVRIVMPKYYGGSEAGLASVFAEIKARRCSFLVAGRAVAGAPGAPPAFRTLSDIPLPPWLAGLFAPIPEEAFRADVSSTELRAAGRGLGARTAAA